MPETRYARCGALALAYQEFGEGDVDVVVAGSFVSHVELMWGSAEMTRFFDRLAEFARVVVFDKAGVGLSDPVPKVRTLEERVHELEAVMDATGTERAAIMGISEGGPAAVLFAATRPERVRALVLTGTFAATGVGESSFIDRTAAELRAEFAAMYDEPYVPGEDQAERFRLFGEAIRDRWGTGEALSYLLPSIRSRAQLGILERMSASPGMAWATFEAALGIDVRPVLASIAAPTLVIHAREDFVPVQYGRYLADHIAGARIHEVDGGDHAPWLSAPDQILSEVERFLTGTARAAPARRALRTIVFTDIVGSTRRAAALGDEGWQALFGRFDGATREAVARSDATLVKAMGDGHLIAVDGPAQAIRCAEAIREAAGGLGLDVRIGVHTGECDLLDGDIGGIAVHIGARVLSRAAGGEILVSSTVRDLVVGSGIAFEDRGTHDLEGVPGEWRLLAVSTGVGASQSPEVRLARQPTPAPGSSARRSDRALAALTRRAPAVARTITRRLNDG